MTTALKMCGHCSKELPITSFGLDKQALDGHRGECKKCRNLYEKALKEKDPSYRARQQASSRKWHRENRHRVTAYHKAWEQKNWERVRNRKRISAMWRKYGLTGEDYLRMLKRQDGRLFHIDHDHITGKIGGLLCFRCNRGLGFLATL